MARTKRARKTRRKPEFNLARLMADLQIPREPCGVFAWSLEEIRDARDAQLRGQFRRPVQMRHSMGTDDAIFTAKRNRLAPEQSVGIVLKSAGGVRGDAIANEAEALFGKDGVGLTAGVRADLHSCLVDHGIAIGFCIDTPREDGSRVDKEVHYWPLEFVRWDPFAQCLMTQVADATDAEREAHPEITMIGLNEVPIVHGDGRWIVIQKHAHEPWKEDACLLPASMTWARHAYANRDWAKGSGAHGNAKVGGEMPAGMPLVDKNGNLTADAKAFLALLQAMVSPDAMAGIRPAGSKVDYIANASTAWQVWAELVKNAEKSGARIYLGTDGMLGSVGGAPGVDIATLFGVATTKIQGDLDALERGIQTGAIEPWCATNFGDSSLAPLFRYQMPDPDAEAVAKAYGERSKAFHEDVEKRRALGYVIDQPLLSELAKKYDVLAPSLPAAGNDAPAIQFAPTDIAKFVTVNQALASLRLPPLKMPDGTPNPDGFLTVSAYDAKQQAKADAAKTIATTPPAPGVRPVAPPAAA